MDRDTFILTVLGKIQKQKSPKSQKKSKNMQTAILSGLQYKVADNPPWITTILLGFQHYLMLLSSNLATPGIMASVICAIGIPEENHVKSMLLGNMIFACGICTLVQTFFGARLPIVQCPAFAYIVPMLALTKIGQWKCPAADAANIENGVNTTTMMPNTTIGGDEEKEHITRINMLTGTIMVAAILEILIGVSGLVSVLLRFIGPLTVAPTIMLMGLSVAETGFNLAGQHWGISGGTIVLIIVFSEVIPVFEIRNPFSKGHDQKIEFVLHKIFSVILSTCIMWLLCYILTAAGALPDDEKMYGYNARTDLRLNVISEVPWVRFPYPGHWGVPTFNSAFFVAMVAGVVTSVIESIGDYYTCARLAGALPPPPSAVNRGIFVEGIDCILAAAVGAGFGVTSCSQNIGVISLTKVGSRRVVLAAGFIMTLFGCLGKFSALVVTMPDPIIGASFLVLFGVLAAVGASNLQYVDLNSSRNLVVFGISLFLGLAFPNWVVDNADLIKTDNENLDQVINALLANNMFMGCFSALILDNVIPGTDEERGIIIWREVPDYSDEDSDDLDEHDNVNLSLKTYDLPFFNNLVRNWKWGKYVPIFPSFQGFDEARCPCKCLQSKHIAADEEIEVIHNCNGVDSEKKSEF
ncbi:solute carrier family 23 member 1-like isoform X2 [Mercenaria mercenaria]|uniref:solute carrier family 23 member 1-like isoform X2 n=1 Tax=Mercenaria mercenaria TaxID=6596 RepID=UPI00234F1BA0|nr:solute carrier family 23 member 1-like isoform X2 [Mercenaria mercenaria]